MLIGAIGLLLVIVHVGLKGNLFIVLDDGDNGVAEDGTVAVVACSSG